jgi:hypothetical protein
MTNRQNLSAVIHDIQARLKLNRRKSCQMARSGQPNCVNKKFVLGLEQEALERELQIKSSEIIALLRMQK